MKTAITVFCVLCAVLSSKAQSIKQAEYFIDKDKGIGKNTKLNLPASVDSIYSFDIDLSGISTGYHKLYVRTKSSNEKWSLALRQNIEVIASFDQQKIMAGEYFFDSDPGHGKANEISVTASDSDIAQNFMVTTLNLKNGYHKLYSRFKDSLGNWSITSRRSIEIIKTADTIKIVAAEYFFSSDKGYGKAAKKIFDSAVEDGKFKFKIRYDKIPAGSDTLFVRVKDSLGNWSLTKFAAFTIQSLMQDFADADSRIDNSNAKKLSVFPNPATQFVNINYQLQNKTAALQILDVNGKPVLQKIIRENNSNLDVSKLAPGTYLLKIADGDNIQTVKFIKQ